MPERFADFIFGLQDHAASSGWSSGWTLAWTQLSSQWPQATQQEPNEEYRWLFLKSTTTSEDVMVAPSWCCSETRGGVSLLARFVCTGVDTIIKLGCGTEQPSPAHLGEAVSAPTLERFVCGKTTDPATGTDKCCLATGARKSPANMDNMVLQSRSLSH